MGAQKKRKESACLAFELISYGVSLFSFVGGNTFSRTGGTGVESSEHLLTECDALLARRLDCLGSIVIEPPFLNLKKSQLVRFLQPIDSLGFFIEED